MYMVRIKCCDQQVDTNSLQEQSKERNQRSIRLETPYSSTFFSYYNQPEILSTSYQPISEGRNKTSIVNYTF